MSVDLLLITCNRSKYLGKTLERLLASPDDFLLYCWDNGSKDGAAELIRGITDSRVVERYFSPTNVNQRPPCKWFFDRCTSDVVGKVDDDVLLPDGWTTRIAEMVRADSRFGMLGCWIFMEDEFDAERAKLNTVTVSGYPVLRAVGIAGQAFLSRVAYMRQYYVAEGGHGLPVNRSQMTLDGLVSGYPMPPIFAHNMDHPLSPLNVYTTEETWGTESMALTARALGFRNLAEGLEWMRRDVRRTLEVPFDRQVLDLLLGREREKLTKWQRRRLRILERLGLGLK